MMGWYYKLAAASAKWYKANNFEQHIYTFSDRHALSLQTLHRDQTEFTLSKSNNQLTDLPSIMCFWRRTLWATLESLKTMKPKPRARPVRRSLMTRASKTSPKVWKYWRRLSSVVSQEIPPMNSLHEDSNSILSNDDSLTQGMITKHQHEQETKRMKRRNLLLRVKEKSWTWVVIGLQESMDPKGEERWRCVDQKRNVTSSTHQRGSSNRRENLYPREREMPTLPFTSSLFFFFINSKISQIRNTIFF